MCNIFVYNDDHFTDDEDHDVPAEHVPDLIWGNCSSGNCKHNY